MAAPSMKNYFPALEDCLTSKTILVSWKLAASALSASSPDLLLSSAISDFFKDPWTHQVIKNPARLFQKPTRETLESFNVRTASIHITPNRNGDYDIAQLKEDALWLSKGLQINETDALRLVVLEFQERPQSYLAGPLSARDVANVQEAAGVTNAQATSFMGLLDVTKGLDADRIQDEFNGTPARHQRLLATYLSERRYFLTAVDCLMTFLLHSQRAFLAFELNFLRERILADCFGLDEKKGLSIDPFEALASTYVNTVPESIRSAGSGPTDLPTSDVTPELEVEWATSYQVEIIHALSVAFQVFDLGSQVFARPEIVSRWFQLMDEYSFFEVIQGPPELQLPLRTIVCAVSLTLLNLKRTLAFIDGDIDLQEHEDPYVKSPNIMGQIHPTMVAAGEADLASVTPILFAWSLIPRILYFDHQERAEQRDLLQNQRAQDGFELVETARYPLERRNSAGSIVSIEKSPYDLFLVTHGLDRDVGPTEKLAQIATAQGQVYDRIIEMCVCMSGDHNAAFRPLLGARLRLVFVDFLKQTYPLVGYQPGPVTCLLSLLSAGQKYWDTNPDPLLPDQNVAYWALKDVELVRSYLLQALSRFPYEFAPFTQLYRSLATCRVGDERSELLTKLILKTDTLTFDPSLKAPHGVWDGYELVNLEDNENRFQLTEDLPLFTTSSLRNRRSYVEEAFCIPAGTQGRFLSDVSRITYVEFEHSGIALLGKRLEANLEDAYESRLGDLEASEVAEAVGFIATLVQSECSRASKLSPDAAIEAGLAILREASRSLLRNQDIISVVCETLDVLIQKEIGQLDGAEIYVMSACLQFLDAALSLCPARVWAYMARCELLDTASKTGRLSRITGSLDLFSERFDFLFSAICFFSSLVRSATSSAVARKSGPVPNGRQKPGENAWQGVCEKSMARICLSVAQVALDVLENSITWRFASESDHSLLVRESVNIMHNLITDAFTFGAVDSPKALTACLLPAANYVIDSFLSPSFGPLRLQPLLRSLVVGLRLPEFTLYQGRTQLSSQRTMAVLKFVTTLLKVANWQEKHMEGIQGPIFKCVSLIARLCAVQDSFKATALSLLAALVENVAQTGSEPPSLLGYLGPQISAYFTQLTSRLDKPVSRLNEVVGTWKFFSAIMRNRQQWMANCLLTGKTPREALKSSAEGTKITSNSVLSSAIESLKAIGSLGSEERLAVLDFFNSAQNYWPWTVFAMQQDMSFLDHLRTYVRELKASSLVAKTDAAEAARQARAAAYIAEAIAMQLYHLRHLRREHNFATDIINDLDYFIRDGVQVSGYNKSLHVNLSRNFAARYPSLFLDEFKRTVAASRELGPKYYYAVEIADEMLRHDAGWVGPRQTGFKYEMETANVNLSLFDAQTALFYAWRYLLLELSVSMLPKNKTVARQMLQVAEGCLESNQNFQGPDTIFVQLSHKRADLALTLLQRLAAASLMPKDHRPLLPVAWQTICAVQKPYSREQLPYYRTLLKILFLTLRGSQCSANSDPTPKMDVKTASVALDQLVLLIFDRVVSQGFRTLVTLVHESGSATTPEDMALITAIAQACLLIPGMRDCENQILNILLQYDVLHMATSLWSWADKLAQKGDPIYGELTLLLLLELSTIPSIAEQLAVDGLLGHLTSANLAGFMRRDTVSPFAENVGAVRCYSIWAKAILPLLVNILGVLGATIAPEVVYVLRQFPNLVKSSLVRFDAPGLSRTIAKDSVQYVTLVAVSEVHSLALLTRVLAAMRASNTQIPELEWDYGALLENIDFWLDSRKVLRERLLPVGAREVEWRVSRATEGSGCENKLEEKVVQGLEGVKTVLSDDME